MVVQSGDKRVCQKSAPTKICFFKFFFSLESYVKVLISTRNLENEKEEAMKELLKQEVHTYLRFHDHSGDEPHQAITHFTVHLINVYKVRLVTLGVNSVFIILDCPTLGSLEHLWSDYLSGHLNKVAERYLVTDKMREKLNLQTICLTTTIAVENYLNCKKALTERPSTCSGEFKSLSRR